MCSSRDNQLKSSALLYAENIFDLFKITVDRLEQNFENEGFIKKVCQKIQNFLFLLYIFIIFY